DGDNCARRLWFGIWLVDAARGRPSCHLSFLLRLGLGGRESIIPSNVRKSLPILELLLENLNSLSILASITPDIDWADPLLFKELTKMMKMRGTFSGIAASLLILLSA